MTTKSCKKELKEELCLTEINWLIEFAVTADGNVALSLLQQGMTVR